MPNFDAPLGVSVGLSYVAGALRRAGHEVAALHITELLGYPWDLERVLADVQSHAPGLVGISTGFNHYAEMGALAEAIETRLHVPVVLGGVHPTLQSATVMAQNPHLSYVAVGEGEDKLTALADALQSGGDTTSIPGLHARVDGAVKRNPVRGFVDLATLAPMANDIWDFQRVADMRRGWVNVSSQRGCPYRCTYCHNNGEAKLYAAERGVPDNNSWYLRYRPPEAMVEELRAIRDRWRFQAFSFIDDTFTMNPPWLERLLALYRRDVDMPFICNTTPVDLDEGLVRLLADSGCRVVRMGVESGSARMRARLLKRPFPEQRIRWAFRETQARGLHALAFNMIGNVGESQEEMVETFRFNADLRPTMMKLALAYPYPGTEYADASAGHVDPQRSTHNFISGSVLRRSPEDALWLDKARTFYFWHVNRFLEGEAGRAFAERVEALEALSAEQWADPAVQGALWASHHALSADLQRRGAFHYTTPFLERTDIIVSSELVASQREVIRREAVEREAVEPH